MTGSGYAVATASPAAELFYFRRSVASNEKINGSSLAPLIIQMNAGTQDNYRELKKIVVDAVVIAQFRGDKLACERIYWDHANVLRQVGLLNM